MSECPVCEKPIIQPTGGHHQRVYCSDACKMRAYRRKKTEATEHQADLQAARLEISILQSEITDLQRENRALRAKLDVETRYLEDQAVHGFKPWLKKQAQLSDVAQQWLADELLPPRDTRAHYEYHLKRRKYSPEEMQEFTRLWKLMLLQS